jgi:F0F1-type ATP synthase beta subunit
VKNPALFFIFAPGTPYGDIEQTTDYATVKFDTAKLPPILNALETTNNNQKLVLEVAVSSQRLV